MKKLTASLITAGVIVGASISAPVLAAGPSGNVSITNDYVWRGISQSGGQPVVQGGLDWEKDKLSFGVWGSGLSTAGTELDVYGAYNFGAFSVGAIYYYYPDSVTDIDFYELNVGGDAGPVALMASYDFKNSAYYVEGSGSVPMGKASLDMHLGYGDGQGGASADYDISVGVSGSAGGVDLGLSYWYAPLEVGNEGKIIFSVGKSL